MTAGRIFIPLPIMFVYAEGNRTILEFAKSYSFRNSAGLAFEQTARDLPVSLLGRAGKDVEED